MPKEIGEQRQVPGLDRSLDDRIAGLRRHRAALSQLIESLTEYAAYVGRDSDLANAVQLCDPRTRSGESKGHDA